MICDMQSMSILLDPNHAKVIFDEAFGVAHCVWWHWQHVSSYSASAIRKTSSYPQLPLCRVNLTATFETDSTPGNRLHSI